MEYVFDLPEGARLTATISQAGLWQYILCSPCDTQCRRREFSKSLKWFENMIPIER